MINSDSVPPETLRHYKKYSTTATVSRFGKVLAASLLQRHFSTFELSIPWGAQRPLSPDCNARVCVKELNNEKELKKDLLSLKQLYRFFPASVCFVSYKPFFSPNLDNFGIREYNYISNCAPCELVIRPFSFNVN